jgi:RNA polymerase sigma-70 factor (ECF subfamily)
MEANSSLFGLCVKCGDIKAFKHFFEGFYPSVCVFARKYLKDSDLAEDLAQEAFIEFWKQKEKFTDLKAMKGFIYTVTRNKCLNHLKLKGIRENILKNEFFAEDHFYELILEEETYRHVHQAVNSLASQSRKIVWLSLEGNRNQEIADHLNVSVNTVKTLKKNAYKELRIQLKDQVFVLLLLSQFLN